MRTELKRVGGTEKGRNRWREKGREGKGKKLRKKIDLPKLFPL
jgi:hypothetical protein